MANKLTKIILAGEGGQGIQTIAKVFSIAFEKAGFDVCYIPQFGPEQRGTPSIAFVQMGHGPIGYPQFSQADILIVLRRRALPAISKFIDRHTEVIFDSSTIPRHLISQSNNRIWGIPATKISEEKFKTKTLNLIVLSAVAKKFFDYPKNVLWEIVESILEKKFAKKPELRKASLEAFNFAYDLPLEQKKFSKADYDTSDKMIVKKNSNRLAVIIPKYCKGCGICILKCPVNALSFGKNLGVYGTPTPEIDLEKCIACGNCFKFCPDCAIRVIKN